MSLYRFGSKKVPGGKQLALERRSSLPFIHKIQKKESDQMVKTSSLDDDIRIKSPLRTLHPLKVCSLSFFTNSYFLHVLFQQNKTEM
jgi:hypothetical protein